MPNYQRPIQLDRMFQQLPAPPILLNTRSSVSDEEKKNISDLIATKYDTDLLAAVPACQKGCTKGEYAVGRRCEKCGTVVSSAVNVDIEPILWLQSPIGIKGLINPTVFIILRNRFRKPGFCTISWLMNTTYKPAPKQIPVLQSLLEAGLTRGYNNFVENFDQIMDVLFNLKDFRLKKGKTDDCLRFIQQYRDTVFSQYLPLPNKTLLIIESTKLGKYITETIVDAVDAIKILEGIDSPIEAYSVAVKENRVAKSIMTLAQFYMNFDATVFDSKTGMLRKHVYASRSHWAFRAVITSLTGPHTYDEIHIPWSVAVVIFRTHLMNILLNEGMTHNEAIGLLHASVDRYNEKLDMLFQQLIRDTPKGQGFICMEQRPPTMLAGSLQRTRITKVKIDPGDKTVSRSILTVKSENADFDGKALPSLNFSNCRDSLRALVTTTQPERANVTVH